MGGAPSTTAATAGQAAAGPAPSGPAARTLAAAALAAGVVVLPLLTNDLWDGRLALAAIFAVVGLSVSVLTGRSGQLSLGHQGLVGVGAFTSALVAGAPSGGAFFVALPLAGLAGAAVALALGLIARRGGWIGLAVITLAFGRMAQTSLFRWHAFAGPAAGAPAPRPSAFRSDQAYAYLCLAVLGLVLVLDWRLARTKAGRAMAAVRRDQRHAAALGIDPWAYRLLALGLAGFLAGLAGSLLAHRSGVVRAADFDISLALIWLVMAVVGGLESRAGVVIASALFALLPFLLPGHPLSVPVLGDRSSAAVTPLAGSILLLLTLALYPGGIGRVLLPLRRWMAGSPDGRNR